jgi:DNA repair photolyase
VRARRIRAKTIVNVHKHVDGPWFWTKYSARPYIGCRSGCEFCFYRGGVYLGPRNPDDFDQVIDVKENAVERLDQQLSRLGPDVINCGDWQQPIEEREQLSRRMLEVVEKHQFPLLVIERSPLLERDIDLLKRQKWCGVILSLSSVDPKLKRAFEPRSPSIQQRLLLLSRLREHGILAGVSLMPILPLCGDDEDHLRETIAAAVDHGAQFVIGGGLTMNGVQAERTLAAAATLDAKLPGELRVMYVDNSSPPRSYTARIGRLVRELCARSGIADRMPRYIAEGPLAANKRAAEKLFLRAYEPELEEADERRIWAYRKAAWAVDEADAPVGDYRALPGIGASIAAFLER